MNMDDLMTHFADNGWIDSHPSAESFNTSALIIERIILRLNS